MRGGGLGGGGGGGGGGGALFATRNTRTCEEEEIFNNCKNNLQRHAHTLSGDAERITQEEAWRQSKSQHRHYGSPP